jgi:hypothetical protein
MEGYDMLLPKMKPGERVLVEVSCVQDGEGRVSLMVDVIERREAKPSKLHRGRVKPLTVRGGSV